MYNRVVLVGRLTQAPELKYTNTGVPIVRFGLAVNRNFKNAQGVSETDFFNIVLWRKLAEISAKFLKKGKLVLIEGRLQTRKYQAQDGSQRTAFEIQADQMQMLDSKGKEDGDASHSYVKESYSAGPDMSSEMTFSGKEDDSDKPGQDDMDFEDVPF